MDAGVDAWKQRGGAQSVPVECSECGSPSGPVYIVLERAWCCECLKGLLQKKNAHMHVTFGPLEYVGSNGAYCGGDTIIARQITNIQLCDSTDCETE